VGLTGGTVQHVRKTGVEVDLNKDRHREHGDNQRLRQDLLPLEAEQKNERRQQRYKRQRLQLGEKARECGFTTPGQN